MAETVIPTCGRGGIFGLAKATLFPPGRGCRRKRWHYIIIFILPGSKYRFCCKYVGTIKLETDTVQNLIRFKFGLIKKFGYSLEVRRDFLMYGIWYLFNGNVYYALNQTWLFFITSR